MNELHEKLSGIREVLNVFSKSQECNLPKTDNDMLDACFGEKGKEMMNKDICMSSVFRGFHPHPSPFP